MSAASAAVARLGVSAALVLGLVGCSAGEPAPETTLDLESEFLAVMCPANAADLAFTEVWESPTSSLDEIAAAAVAARDADAAAAASLSALAERWPEEFDTDLAVIERMYTAKVADYTRVADTATVDSFADLTFSNPTAGHAAYERIAERIGASIDQC